MRGAYMQSIWSMSACFDGALYSPFTLSLARRTKVSASLPPAVTTALYLTSFVLQNSASFRFFGTFISGAALPVKLTTPLTVAVPIAPPGPGSFVVGAALATVVVGGLAVTVFAVDTGSFLGS